MLTKDNIQLLVAITMPLDATLREDETDAECGSLSWKLMAPRNGRLDEWQRQS